MVEHLIPQTDISKVYFIEKKIKENYEFSLFTVSFFLYCNCNIHKFEDK
jgi:hypothetical protein